MKAPKVFAVVLVAHLLAFSILFVQQGCQTIPPEERVDRTRPVGPGETQPARTDYERAAPRDERREAPVERAAPARPDRPVTAPAEDDEFDRPEFVDEESILSPLPRDAADEPDFEPEPDPIEVPSAAPEDTRTYVVQQGDNVWNIARRENVSMDELLEMNNLTRESVIQPGQELSIPAGSGERSVQRDRAPEREIPEPPEGAETYTVQRGDSLSVIAQRHGTTIAELKSINNLQSDNIRIGQELALPDGESPRPPREDAAPAEPEEPAAEGIRHTVVSGESPGGIANRYGVSVEELMRVNNISDPRRVRVGQELVIPGTEEEDARDESEEEETEPVDEALSVVPDEPEEMEFIEDDEDDGDVPLIDIIPDDDEEVDDE